MKEIILYNLLDDLDLDNWKPINLSPTKLVKGTSSLFSCHICDKSYRHNKDLLRHIRVKHERTKTYSCLTCKKEFGYKSSLKQHSNICMGVPQQQIGGGTTDNDQHSGVGTSDNEQQSGASVTDNNEKPCNFYQNALNGLLVKRHLYKGRVRPISEMA